MLLVLTSGKGKLFVVYNILRERNEKHKSILTTLII